MPDPADPCPLLLVGVGKIARDQHLPAIAADPRFALAATVSHAGEVDGVPLFPSIAAARAALPGLRAVAICTPPIGRLALVEEAAAAGLAILLEKPTAATLSEAEAIVAVAAAAGVPLFLAWHSREAAAVAPAAAWLAGKQVRRVAVTWKEDVRVWHPGQDWIWTPGIGIFDPGINAFSVLTRLLGPLLVERADLAFPANKPAPMAADLLLRTREGIEVACAFDFDQRGPQSWDIAIATEAGELNLSDGGARWSVDGGECATAPGGEYPRLYDRFAELLARGASDADLAPFRLVADCFQIGTRRELAPFSWDD